jgi:hypothetical protein
MVDLGVQRQGACHFTLVILDCEGYAAKLSVFRGIRLRAEGNAQWWAGVRLRLLPSMFCVLNVLECD